EVRSDCLHPRRGVTVSSGPNATDRSIGGRPVGAGMSGTMLRTVVACGMLVGAVWAGDAAAQSSGTRSQGFTQDPASGLVTREVIEPNTTALRLQTDITYDAFGNKQTVTVSGADIATRTATTTYDSQGRFPATVSNALGQSERWQYDPRFGKPTS